MAHTIIELPQSTLEDHTKLMCRHLNLGETLAAITVQLSDSVVPGISVFNANCPEILIKIENFRQLIRPLVGLDEIRVCVNWPGYSHVKTRHQTLRVPIFNYSTLAGLVGQVAKQLEKYMVDCSRREISDDAQAYKIHRFPDGETNSGDVFIVGFTNTFHGIWQVDLNIRI
ncbi:hypothetical protein DFH11DRAFT_134826 [Phellopilus nigrolimitatus]|nr:hypothetical protein DFH11DRAFT_134826 [Phellopilus nigrolimitatus]